MEFVDLFTKIYIFCSKFGILKWIYKVIAYSFFIFGAVATFLQVLRFLQVREATKEMIIANLLAIAIFMSIFLIGRFMVYAIKEVD